MSVSESDVKDAMATKNKIQLIKLYRGHTGVGLKDAKDAVETVIPIGCWDEHPAWDSKEKEMLALFFGKANEEREREIADEMMKAMLVMRDSWKELGFKSFKAGVLVILDNF